MMCLCSQNQLATKAVLDLWCTRKPKSVIHVFLNSLLNFEGCFAVALDAIRFPE